MNTAAGSGQSGPTTALDVPGAIANRSVARCAWTPAVRQSRRTDRRATNSSSRAFAYAFATYADSNPSFRYNGMPISVIDAPSSMAATSADAVNCHASAVTVRIRSNECCILNLTSEATDRIHCPSYNRPKSTSVPGWTETFFGHRHDHDQH